MKSKIIFSITVAATLQTTSASSISPDPPVDLATRVQNSEYIFVGKATVSSIKDSSGKKSEKRSARSSVGSALHYKVQVSKTLKPSDSSIPRKITVIQEAGIINPNELLGKPAIFFTRRSTAVSNTENYEFVYNGQPTEDIGKQVSIEELIDSTKQQGSKVEQTRSEWNSHVKWHSPECRMDSFVAQHLPKDPVERSIYELCDQDCGTMQLIHTQLAYDAYKRGLGFLSAGRYKESADCFTEVISRVPLAEAYEARAQAYELQGLFVESAKDRQMAFKLKKRPILKQ